MTGPASALRTVQVALHDHLLDRPSAIADGLREGGRITIGQRLQIYHGAFRSRLLEAMQGSSERTWAYLGDTGFAATATAFIEGNPPRDRNLRWYGDLLPTWVADAYPGDADIGELAMIDWRLRGAFDGADVQPVAADALSGLTAADWTSVGCRFVPTLDIAPLRFNTVGIWHALDRGETPPAASPLAEPAWLLIWRREWHPHFRTPGADEVAALSRLQAGEPVAAVCTTGGADVSRERYATMVATWVRAWLDDQLIAELTGIAPR